MKKTILLCCALMLLSMGCQANYRGIISDSDSQSERMLIKRGYLTIEVDNIEKSVEDTLKLIKLEKGYTEDKSIEEKSAFLLLRVPSKNLNSTINKLSSIGNVTNKSVSAEDVTEQYVDTEARMKNKVVLRDRLKQLLNKAKDVKDILAIEKELNRIQGDIDSMQALLKSMKNKVDYATLSVNFKHKKILGPLGYVVSGVAWFAEKLFIIQE